MYLVAKIHLFERFWTICYVYEDFISLRDEECYKLIGIKSTNHNASYDKTNLVPKKRFKLVANALLLQPLLKLCADSKVYRLKMLKNFIETCPFTDGGIILRLILKPPDKEIIDYSWNERILKLVWTRIEIENAFSWLSTLGGAYSALGDYFQHCAEEAGRISLRQYKLSKMLGDDGLAARSRLYSALSYAQKGYLNLSRHIVRGVAAFARGSHDKRLMRMCQGVWVKLKYMRSIKKRSRSDKIDDRGGGNGVVNVNI